MCIRDSYSAAVLGKVLPLPVMVLCGGVASFVLALIIGSITLRLRGIYFAIFTLSSVAVSYTHLDVYKRQAQHCRAIKPNTVKSRRGQGGITGRAGKKGPAQG